MREVGRNAVLGSFTTAGGGLLGFVLRFAMNAVLARYIAPEQFGVYAQASVYATFVGLLGASRHSTSSHAVHDRSLGPWPSSSESTPFMPTPPRSS